MTFEALFFYLLIERDLVYFQFLPIFLVLLQLNSLMNFIVEMLCLKLPSCVFLISNICIVFRVSIAWYKDERVWENSRQICKPETKSRVCKTVENSPNPSSVYIRLCKHRKEVFYCFYKIFLKINSTNEGNFVYWLLDPKRFSQYTL